MSVVTPLGAHDLRAALTVAGELASCGDPPELEDRLRSLPALIGADSAFVSAASSAGQMTLVAGDPELYRPELMAIVTDHWRDHPVLVDDVARVTTGARRLSDFITTRKLRRSGLFAHFYRPLGMMRELAVQLSWRPVGESRCLVLHRSGSDFGERERALVEQLAPHVAAALTRVAAGARPAPWASLSEHEQLAELLPITRREAEVLARLAAGRTNDGIAYDLGISRHTVVRHVERVYAKLGTHTRAAATRAALDALHGAR